MTSTADPTIPAAAGATAVFDRLFAEGAEAVRAGTHGRDEPPIEGGRWPVSILLRPPEPVRGQLAGLAGEAARPAGVDHFLTGVGDSVHLTVRALEPYREAARETDHVTRQWTQALRRACARTAPLTFAFTGVTLTTSAVMAQVEPVDPAPWAFLRTVQECLGPLSWYEDRWARARGRSRDIWYATLLHFAAPVADPLALVDWVGNRRRLPARHFTIEAAELVRFHYTAGPPRRMRPETWLSEPLTRDITSHRDTERTTR